MIRTNITPCPCAESGCMGSKLARATGHVLNCGCVSCRNGRNHKRGHQAQQAVHAGLGGKGKAPTNEDKAKPYELKVMPESKTGDQVPAAFHKLVRSDWWRHAIHQSKVAIPVGSGVLPAVAIDERYVIVDLKAGPHA